jgi:hypothetical protein
MNARVRAHGLTLGLYVPWTIGACVPDRPKSPKEILSLSISPPAVRPIGRRDITTMLKESFIAAAARVTAAASVLFDEKV